MRTQLPVVAPEAFDFSITNTVGRCPRKAWYQYWLGRRSIQRNYPMDFGSAYHLYRDTLDRVFLQEDTPEEKWDILHEYALTKALEIYDENPPLEHKKAFLTQVRLIESCEQGFDVWKDEVLSGRVTLLASEQSFNLVLDDTGYSFGGKIDRLIEQNGQFWVQDYKTTSYMGRTYGYKWDPNAQISGYTWGARELSGRRVMGVIIETIYNTKNKGPEHHNFLSTRSGFHIDEWKRDYVETRHSIERYEAEQYFPKNTAACDDYGGCFFRACCAMSSWAARDEWLNNFTVEDRWDFMKGEDE